MKIIFLDVDGVLNSDASLMTDDSLEEALILRLKTLVEQTGAKIVLSSSWRFCFNPLRRLMDKLAAVNLNLYSMTPNGVPIDWLKKHNYEPTNKYLDTVEDYEGKEIDITTDRGAEILRWLWEHPDTESFVILDDEAFDIFRYFPDNFIKTNFRTGVTDKDILKAKEILERK